MKVGRNDPCPCGSGKKYKKCCLEKDSKITQFPGKSENTGSDSFQNAPFSQDMMLSSIGFNSVEEMDLAMKDYEMYCEYAHEEGKPIPSFREYLGKGNMASDMLGQIHEELKSQDFESIDEMNKYMSGMKEEINDRPVDDFLGLTPIQMRNIFENELFGNDDIIEPNLSLSVSDVINTPIILQSLFFLKMLENESGSIPLTGKGNLKREHCNLILSFIFDKNLEEISVKSEDDFPNLRILREILDISGYIQILKTKIRLTEKGYDLLETESLNIFYFDLFDSFVEIYDWLEPYLFHDDCSIIEETVLFSLLILKKKAGDFISQEQIYSIFLSAFPSISDIPVLPNRINIMHRVYDMLFLNQFCRFFGLVESKLDSDDFEKSLYKTSELFDKLFIWKIN